MAGLASSTFVLIMAAAFALFTAVGAVVPVLPRYVDGPLGGGGVAVGFVVGTFFVATLLARPLAGRLGDEHGRRVVMNDDEGLDRLMTAVFASLASHDL